MAEHVPEDIREHGPLQSELRLVQIADEVQSLKQEAAWQRGDRAARTLVKEGKLRVVLTAMRARTSLQEHRTEGATTIQCIDGRLRVLALERSIELLPGALIALDAGLPHRIEATAECAFLLTIAR
ncbi:MAG TPA: hypothetical protein VKV26_17930 [Dehalococcoidia bacterium]|nr:hypothetical protein [Dehalococcoidia bacterium]